MQIILNPARTPSKNSQRLCSAVAERSGDTAFGVTLLHVKVASRFALPPHSKVTKENAYIPGNFATLRLCVKSDPHAVGTLLLFQRHHVGLRGADECGARLSDGGDAKSLEIISGVNCFATNDRRRMAGRVKNRLQF
jgi:hypothetical protein